MAQDPAFIFYSSDFITGTQFFSFEQRGQYITLLCMQHQQGHLPEKHMLFICGTHDNDVMKKFEVDADGLYFNRRLDSEVLKRKNYSESRRNNRVGNSLKPKPEKRKKISKSYVEHMENENENTIGLIIPNNSERISKIWDKWIEYKKRQHKFKYASLQYEQMALNQLVKMTNGDEDLIVATIEHTMCNSWKGFVVPKDFSTTTQTQMHF